MFHFPILPLYSYFDLLDLRSRVFYSLRRKVFKTFVDFCTSGQVRSDMKRVRVSVSIIGLLRRGSI